MEDCAGLGQGVCWLGQQLERNVTPDTDRQNGDLIKMILVLVIIVGLIMFCSSWLC